MSVENTSGETGYWQYPLKTAVILAAGRGVRISSIVKDIPKGFIKIGGQTLIERSIALLRNSGIERIIIVTGHLNEFYENLANTYPFISTVHNKDYADSGSMYSYYCARELIREDTLLLESDLIYEKRGLEDLIAFIRRDAILISGKTGSGDEVYVETRGSNVTNLAKDHTLLQNVTGELVGISKISYPLYQKMVTTAEKMFATSLKVEYESCLVATAADYPLHYLKIDDLIWSEIDDESHLRRVEESIFPRLNDADTLTKKGRDVQ